jgi:hypothetical protein
MPKIQYVEKNFNKSTLALIEKANEIINDYEADSLSLTLRQLYYQFVSRDLIQNVQSEYKRLGNIVSDARLAGLIDWYAIEDRTRNLKGNYHNTDPGQAVQDALEQFMLDRWEDQPYRVEVWIEKEALAGVISRICQELDVPYFACKGYTSQSEMWNAARRMAGYKEYYHQVPVIIHLGDHDPSGVDMTRDIKDRYKTFMGGLTVKRIALNYDQIEDYQPPPNPAKLTDTRATSYIENYGMSSWELDALEPRVIRDLIRNKVAEYTDRDIWEATLKKEDEYKKILENVTENWQSL